MYSLLSTFLKLYSNILESSSHDEPKTSSHDEPLTSSHHQPLSAIMSEKVKEYLEHQKKLHQEGKAAQAQGAQIPEEQPTMTQQEIEGVKM